MVTGANALLALFSETASPAARLLDEHGMIRRDVENIVVQDIGKGTGDTQV
jgi:ATP-dependent Lon protease